MITKLGLIGADPRQNNVRDVDALHGLGLDRHRTGDKIAALVALHVLGEVVRACEAVQALQAPVRTNKLY